MRDCFLVQTTTPTLWAGGCYSFQPTNLQYCAVLTRSRPQACLNMPLLIRLRSDNSHGRPRRHPRTSQLHKPTLATTARVFCSTNFVNGYCTCRESRTTWCLQTLRPVRLLSHSSAVPNACDIHGSTAPSIERIFGKSILKSATITETDNHVGMK
jgi:hypothetical protein